MWPGVRVRMLSIPEDCLSLFTDGSAMYDKDMKCWVSAGFGFVAVKGGDGPEHDGGSSIHEHQGPVDLGDFGGAVRNRTNNVSELVAGPIYIYIYLSHLSHQTSRGQSVTTHRWSWRTERRGRSWRRRSNGKATDGHIGLRMRIKRARSLRCGDTRTLGVTLLTLRRGR